MTLDSLKIVGERINYSIPRIKDLMDSGNFEEIKRIAQEQEIQGAEYLDINIGSLPVEMMALITSAVQEAVNIPLCFDSDDVLKLEKGLESYDYRKGLPIINSATESRIERVLSLKNKKNFQAVLLVSERIGGNSLVQNISSEDAYKTAKRLFLKARDYGLHADQIYIDPGTPPIGADESGLVNMALETIQRVNSDPDIKGVHTLVGLTNLTFSLPQKGRLPLQNAFLTVAVENGLDTIIGNPGRKYEILKAEDPYLKALKKVLKSEDKFRTFISEIYPLMK